MRPDVVALRDELLASIRAFFRARRYREVQTPVRVPAPALEEHIDAVPADSRFLRTSPELHMKRLLAAGHERIVQIGPCFRRGESGPRHRPEFTMLEWYRVDADCADLIDETRELLCAVAEAVLPSASCAFGGHCLDLSAPWRVLTVAEAFAEFANGVSVEAAVRGGEFERVLSDRIEPHLGTSAPTALTRYPAELAALARLCPDDPRWADRWELYLGGMEIASAFSELTDPDEQRRRFLETAENRRLADRPVYPLDEPFLQALACPGLPRCSGVALGVDRLLMVLAGTPRIQNVVPFADEIA